tara:strand:- start:1128 stop:1658 length:531 start_codon:yes stop_codon:yes gene_type:complete
MAAPQAEQYLEDEQDYEYSLFSYEELDEIEGIFIFVDKNNNIKYIKQETISLSAPNEIKKTELEEIIQHNLDETRNTFRISSLCQYTNNLHSSQIFDYINKDEDEKEYIKNIKQFSKIQDIKFENSMIMFHDINSLIFILTEVSIPTVIQKGKLKKKKTKRILENIISRKKSRKQV